MTLIDLNEVTDARLNRRQEPVDFTVESRSDFTRLKEIWAERLMVPILLRQRTEGIDASFGGRDSRLYLTGDDSAGRYCVEEVVYAPGWDFPAYHMEEAEEHWYVADGEVEITVGNRTQTCRAGAFAFIPRRTTRRLRNKSSAPARVFQWSNPAGFDRALLALAAIHRSETTPDVGSLAAHLQRYAVVLHERDMSLPNDVRVNESVSHIPFDPDSIDSLRRFREVWAARQMTPKLLGNYTQGEEIEAVPGVPHWCVLSGDDSAGRAMSIVAEVPPEVFVPAHFQPTEEELFYSLDDGVSWRIGSEEITTEKGSFAFAPRNGTHQFGNGSDRVRRMMTINSPAGHERALGAIRGRDLSMAENAHFFDSWGWYIRS